MTTSETKDTGTIPSEVMADMEKLCQQAGIVRDPELLGRVYDRSSQGRAETLRTLGVQDIGVQIIREMRDGR